MLWSLIETEVPYVANSNSKHAYFCMLLLVSQAGTNPITNPDQGLDANPVLTVLFRTMYAGPGKLALSRDRTSKLVPINSPCISL